MSQSVIPHSDEVLTSLCRWISSVPEHITRIYPSYPHFFTSEAIDSECNTTPWWSFEKFCADGHTLNQDMLYAPTPSKPSILLSEVNDSEWHTTLWWNLVTLCRWLYPVPEYITRIIPFSALLLLIIVMNDSEDNPTLWWILRNSIQSDHRWLPHQCDVSKPITATATIWRHQQRNGYFLKRRLSSQRLLFPCNFYGALPSASLLLNTVPISPYKSHFPPKHLTFYENSLKTFFIFTFFTSLQTLDPPATLSHKWLPV